MSDAAPVSKFYYLARNGEQLGPLPSEDVLRLLAAGEVAPTDLLWTEGLSDWQAIAVTPEFADAIAGPALVPESADQAPEPPGEWPSEWGTSTATVSSRNLDAESSYNAMEAATVVASHASLLASHHAQEHVEPEHPAEPAEPAEPAGPVTKSNLAPVRETSLADIEMPASFLSDEDMRPSKTAPAASSPAPATKPTQHEPAAKSPVAPEPAAAERTEARAEISFSAVPLANDGPTVVMPSMTAGHHAAPAPAADLPGSESLDIKIEIAALEPVEPAPSAAKAAPAKPTAPPRAAKSEKAEKIESAAPQEPQEKDQDPSGDSLAQDLAEAASAAGIKPLPFTPEGSGPISLDQAGIKLEPPKLTFNWRILVGGPVYMNYSGLHRLAAIAWGMVVAVDLLYWGLTGKPEIGHALTLVLHVVFSITWEFWIDYNSEKAFPVETRRWRNLTLALVGLVLYGAFAGALVFFFSP